MKTELAHKKITKLLGNNGCLVAGKRVLALCSGGVDSVTLVSLLASMPRGSAPKSITVLHLDHGYRTGTPEQLAEHHAAEKVAKKYSLTFAVATRDQLNDPFDAKKSTQDDARNWRYKTAQKIAQRHGCTVIATGHTASDNVENALMHLSGILASPALCAASAINDNLTLVRPMLNITREEIVTYATDHDLTWADDPTNQNADAYQRNSIRHRVVPALIENHPAAPQAIIKSAKQFEAMKTSNMEMARFLLNMVRVDDTALNVDTESGLMQFSMLTRRAIIHAWLMEISPVTRSFNERTVELICSLCDKPGGRARLSENVEIVHENNHLKVKES